MGLLLLFNGGFMLIAAIVSFITKDGVGLQVSAAALLTSLVGTLLMFLTKDHEKEVKKREGYIIVTFGWLFMSLSGMLPYLFSGTIPSVANAFFETISGYTCLLYTSPSPRD